MVGGRRLQHAATTGDDGRDPLLGQRRLDVGGLGVHAHQHGDVGRSYRAGAVTVGIGQTALVEESAHLGHQVGVDGPLWRCG